MADSPDLEHLAKTYLDLWQRQMSGVMNDPEAAKWITETAQKNLEVGKAWSETLVNAMGEDGVAPQAETGQHNGGRETGKDGDDGDRSDRPGRTEGAEAVNDASGDDDRRLDRIERRLAVLEERLAALEGGAGKRRERSRKKS